MYPVKYLNEINISGMSVAKLLLKVSACVMVCSPSILNRVFVMVQGG